MYRFDYVFSFWIFLWYLLHIFGLVKPSPKLVLLLGFFENLISFVILLFLANDIQRLMRLFVLNIFIKLIPVVTVWSEKIDLYKDLFLIYAVFAVYVFYIHIVNQTTVWDIYEKLYRNILEGRNDPEVNPGTSFMHDFLE